MDVGKFLRFRWKNLALALGLFIVFVILHNLVSAFLGFEESVFFILAVFGVPFYLIVMGIYEIVVYFKNIRK